VKLRPLQPLDQLGAQIRAEHLAAEASAADAIAHAIEAGQLLLQAKDKVEHGEWLPWLTEHCERSERQAQRYMKIATRLPALLEANPTRASDLSIRGALALLTTPKPTVRPDAATRCVEVYRQALWAVTEFIEIVRVQSETASAGDWDTLLEAHRRFESPARLHAEVALRELDNALDELNAAMDAGVVGRDEALAAYITVAKGLDLQNTWAWIRILHQGIAGIIVRPAKTITAGEESEG
jgi:hypothetical protein